MKKILIVSSLILSVAVAGVAIAPTAQAGKDPWAGVSCSSKTTVAVDRFKTENVWSWWTDDMALNSREVAVDELIQSGCFTVLEREEGSMAPVGVMNEKALARSDEARSGHKAARKHQMKVADKLVSFALTGLKKGESGLNVGGLGGAGGGFGGLGGGFKKDEVTLTCKLIDTSSSEILASARVTAGSTGFNVGAGGGGFGGGGFGLGGLNYFKDSKLGKMMSDAIHKCVVQMAKSTGH